MKPYTILQFQKDFPNDDICLDTIFQARYGHLRYCPDCGARGKFYRIRKRKTYSCQHCAYQLSPTAGTIFHKSYTPLTKWFFAMYLFSQAKNGVSAMEIKRHLGVTYKCAWRIAKHIRLLTNEDGDPLSGIVEVDETFIGPPGRKDKTSKTVVMGAVARDGQAKTAIVSTNLVAQSPRASYRHAPAR